MTTSAFKRAELEAQLAEEIAADPQFVDRLIEDPREVLAEILGVDIPEMVNITIHQESLTDVHLTIPARELTGDALDAVAGGMDDVYY